MIKAIAAGITALALSTGASAAIITLESMTPTEGGHIFTYEGTFGPDEGVVSGSRLVIYDFLGYVEGSIFSMSDETTTAVEFTSSGLVAPGFDDDPTIPNLVFTYTGDPFQADGGPYDPFSFTGFGAVSIHNNTQQDAFTTYNITNNPPSSAGAALITLGNTAVPSPIPEPATWAMMVGGFALTGGMLRSRRRNAHQVLA